MKYHIVICFILNVLIWKLGSNDPYALRGPGSGFALCWEGNPKLLINHKNEQNELVQLTSDSLKFIIPKCVLLC